MTSAKIDECCFDQDCFKELVHSLSLTKSKDITITRCEFEFKSPYFVKSAFDALFSNRNVCRLNISHTEIGDCSTASLVKMIRRGILTTLSVCECGMGSATVKKVLKATTHKNSNLKFLSIVGNDVTRKVFEGLEKTSIKELYIGESYTEELTSESYEDLVPDYLFNICSVEVMGSDEYVNEVHLLENMNF